MRTNVAEKKRQLGMHPSTATSLLKKKIIFCLAKKAGFSTCHRCGKELAEEDFTIDHKVPWLHSLNPLDKFFDVENIAFSHAKCNYEVKRRPKDALGVYAVNSRKKPWRAYISINKERKFLGSFKTKEEALQARQNAISVSSV